MFESHLADSKLESSLSAIARLTQQDASDATFQQFHKINETVYQQLLALSEQSIFAPSEQITVFRKHFLNLLYRLDFDPLFGGLLVPCHQQQESTCNTKPILINSLLAELILQSDRLLYTGELTQTAKLINQYLHQRLQATGEDWLNNQIVFSQNQSPNTFQRTEIELLDSQECLLLSALIVDNHSALETVLENELISVFYNRSLLQAAKLIDMPFKQAQILEHAIQLKLKSITKDKSVLAETIDHPILANCQLLRSLCSGMFYLEQSTEHTFWQTNVDNLFDALLKCLDENDLSVQDRIHILAAGFYYLQTKFSSVYLDRLFYHLNKINFDQLAQRLTLNKALESRPTLQQLALLASVTSTFNQSGQLKVAQNQLEASLANYMDNQWTIVLLQKDSVQLDHQLVQIKSEFNPYRLVFCA